MCLSTLTDLKIQTTATTHELPISQTRWAQPTENLSSILVTLWLIVELKNKDWVGTAPLLFYSLRMKS